MISHSKNIAQGCRIRQVSFEKIYLDFLKNAAISMNMTCWNGVSTWMGSQISQLFQDPQFQNQPSLVGTYPSLVTNGRILHLGT